MELSKLNSTKKRILCIWLPDWPVLRQTLDRGEPFDACGLQPYRHQPIVLHEMVRGSRRVAACSAKARALGITVGMPLTEATALVADTCRVSPKPTAHSSHPARATHFVWPHDPRADREALQRLALWCHRYSPLVGLDDAAEPDCLLLDVTGVACFFGGEETLAHRILSQFARREIVARIGLAATVGAAWAAARFGKSGIPPVAQVSNLSIPAVRQVGNLSRQGAIPARSPAIDSAAALPGVSSSVIIPSEQASEFLAAMPLVALRLTDDVLDLLRQLGLQWIGELQALPRADFNARFGPELLRRWDQAAGRLDEPIVALPLPQKFEAEQFFEHPVGDRATLEFVLRQLVQQAAQMAAMAGRGALHVEVYFDSQASGNVGFDVGLFRPSASADHLFGLVQMRLERLRLPGRVETARVRITETAALEKHQAELFDSGTASQHTRQTAELIDRLAGRLGRNRILGVSLLAEAQPERAYRYESLVDARRRGSRRSPPRDLPPRPLQLLPRPVRLAAVAIVPDGPPLHFTLPNGRQRVAKAWGPERIQTGWWRGQPIHRDYYRVETTAGARYWLFRRRTDGKWFLHGVFV
jgi:protein ImuB